jgi:hypothetical protein
LLVHGEIEELALETVTVYMTPNLPSPQSRALRVSRTPRASRTDFSGLEIEQFAGFRIYRISWYKKV